MNSIVNIWAVIAAAAVSVVLGFLWYGPLFGKQWMTMMGISKESITPEQKKGMGKNYLIMIIGSLVTACVLGHSLIYGSAYTHMAGASAGLSVGFWSWLGFVAPITLGSVLWEKRPWKMWILNNGYYLISFLLQGIVLSLWM